MLLGLASNIQIGRLSRDVFPISTQKSLTSWWTSFDTELSFEPINYQYNQIKISQSKAVRNHPYLSTDITIKILTIIQVPYELSLNQ